MNLLNFLPLVPALVLAGALVGTQVSVRVDRLFTRVAIALFGPYVAESRRRTRRERLLNAAHMPTTYRAYAAKTWLYSGVLAVVGSIVGVYAIGGVLATLKISQAMLSRRLPAMLQFLSGLRLVPQLSLVELFGLILVSSATIGVFAGASTYFVRWYLPTERARRRGKRVDESVTRTVAFLYALSRSGMAFPEIMRTLARNRGVYGGAAEEVAVAVRSMDLFGTDMHRALGSMARRTPSERFETLSKNLLSVLQSGQGLSEFLRGEYQRYREEAKERQEMVLEVLSTAAEIYVTVLVAGSLFLITILIVVGLVMEDTVTVLRVLIYLAVPLASAAFIVYLSRITDALMIETHTDPGSEGTDLAEVTRSDRETGSARADGGWMGATDPSRAAGATDAALNLARLRTYRRLHVIGRSVRQPFRTVLERPLRLFYLTVPLALLWVAVSLAAAGPGAAFDPQALDDPLVQGTLFVLGTYAVVRELQRRRTERIEAVVPDFLDRLASLNGAGMTVVESVERLKDSDMGVLDPEIERIWTDIEWGATVGDALGRFERRVRTTAVVRSMTLLTNSMAANNDVAPVLRIAATQARADRRLKRRRRQEMVTYTIIIYVAFLVFLIIVAALVGVLIPSLPTEAAPTAGATAGGAATAGASSVGGLAIVKTLSSMEAATYEGLLFHAALVQAVLSGLIAGQMGEGRLRDGAKHATVLLALAYALTLVL